MSLLVMGGNIAFIINDTATSSHADQVIFLVYAMDWLNFAASFLFIY